VEAAGPPLSHPAALYPETRRCPTLLCPRRRDDHGRSGRPFCRSVPRLLSGACSVSSPLPASPPRLDPTVRVLVLAIASIGFLFDTYELLMFPVIGSDAIAELQFHKGYASLTPQEQGVVREWGGRMLWIAALCGGAFGLLGGWLIDRL